MLTKEQAYTFYSNPYFDILVKAICKNDRGNLKDHHRFLVGQICECITKILVPEKILIIKAIPPEYKFSGLVEMTADPQNLPSPQELLKILIELEDITFISKGIAEKDGSPGLANFFSKMVNEIQSSLTEIQIERSLTFRVDEIKHKISKIEHEIKKISHQIDIASLKELVLSTGLVILEKPAEVKEKTGLNINLKLITKYYEQEKEDLIERRSTIGLKLNQLAGLKKDLEKWQAELTALTVPYDTLLTSPVATFPAQRTTPPLSTNSSLDSKATLTLPKMQ